MFNLNDAIADWRKRMLAGGLRDPAALDELEAHLREDVDQQVRAGADVQSAFNAAAQRIGAPKALKCEFARAVSGAGELARNIKLLFLISLAGFFILTAATVWFGAELPLSVRIGGGLGATLPLLILWAWRYLVRHPLRPGEVDLNDFDPSIGQVMEFSRLEAQGLSHDFIGTEHLLLGLMQLDEPGAVRIREKLGLEIAVVRREIAEFVGTGAYPATRDTFPCTPRAKRAMALAAQQARERAKAGPQDLLLGMWLEGDGVAFRVLKKLGINDAQIRKELESD